MGGRGLSHVFSAAHFESEVKELCMYGHIFDLSILTCLHGLEQSLKGCMVKNIIIVLSCATLHLLYKVATTVDECHICTVSGKPHTNLDLIVLLCGAILHTLGGLLVM